ncbi:MAG: hypothetical protein R3D69_03470 [Xanthobacteraceae bacterium]
MTAISEHTRLTASKPRIQRTEYVGLKKRLDAAQLERTIAALHASLARKLGGRGDRNAAPHCMPARSAGSTDNFVSMGSAA